MGQGSIVETKVAVGSFAGVLTGFITWALVAYVPTFRTGLPDQVAQLLPFGVAWLIYTVGGYLAPHTHRPDLAPADVTVRVTKQPGRPTGWPHDDE